VISQFWREIEQLAFDGMAPFCMVVWEGFGRGGMWRAAYRGV
jgi:hypothetical protein